MSLSGFDMSLLQQKYNAMSKQADADMIRANASMLSAQNSGLGSTSADPNPNAGFQSKLIEAQIKQALAGANASNVAASNAEDDNLIKKRLEDQTYNSNTPSEDQLSGYYKAKAQLEKEAQEKAKANATAGIPSYKKGTARVPKTGKANLHEGEAVLTKEAASHLGRGVIKALNAMGKQKMGMV